MLPRALVVALVVLTACPPPLGKDSIKVVKLPADVQEGPASVAALTKDGVVFAAPSNGGFLMLTPDAGAWQPAGGTEMKRFLRDFKDGSTLAEGANDTGLFSGNKSGFVAVSPVVPALTHAAFSANPPFASVRVRDAQGVWWASSAASFGGFSGKQFLAHFDVGATDWTVEEIPLADGGQAVPAANPAMTSDARFFFRQDRSGVWEVDLPNHVMVERVPCTEALFAAGCDRQAFVFAGLAGETFIFNDARELWRIGSRETLAKLVVKGDLPSLPSEGMRVGAPSFYVDPKGRVWLAFRHGTNVNGDVSYLYVADPAVKDAWIFVSAELPRAVVLLGDGNAPLISSTSQDTGLLLYRVDAP
ncbi:MAG: hypothetical protein QM817_39770 [Archangium sp.]